MKHLAWLATILITVGAAAPAEAHPRCGTIELLPALPRGAAPVVPRRAAGAAKMERDFYGRPAHIRTSANFAVKWGPTGTFTQEQATFLLESLEIAWRYEMEDRAFTPPVGTETYLYNVYIHNTGLNIPDLGYSTYAFIDDEGFPYMMITPLIIDRDDPYLAGETNVTTAHEFFHTVQFATGAYDYFSNGPAYWYWEATADWTSSQVWPDEPVTKEFMPYYLLAPHVGIEAVVFPDESQLDPIMLHHYGAQALPLYLSEQVADIQLIVDSWEEAQPADDPLRNLDGLLAPHGSDLDRAFADFAAHCAAVDFPRRQHYLDAIERAIDGAPDYDHRVAAVIDPAGTAGAVAAPAELLPEAWAFNTLHLDAPAPGRWRLAIDGDPAGSRGTATNLRARVVRTRPAGVEYVALATDGRTGEQIVEVTDDTALDLIVTSQPATTIPDETFAYRYRVEPVVDECTGPDCDPGPGPDEPGGCGCRSTQPGDAAPFGLVLGLWLISLWRRRHG